MKHHHHLDLQIASDHPTIPLEKEFNIWIEAALSHLTMPVDITIRIVDIEESTYLNETYRKKKGPTNVLSFPSILPENMRENTLGDIVICAALVEQEAKAQHKMIQAHWAHLVIHGILHLLGYDHIKEEEAEQMEKKEIKLLQQLHYANPYDIVR